ncbi:glycine cleavage system H-protein subunit [Toensbergia leucococca]|nr:glycine cleavage system H-protein subunit [Toensbergia leucococca]
MAAIARIRRPFNCSKLYTPIRLISRGGLPPRDQAQSLCARLPRSTPRLFVTSAALREKKFTQDHEWIELSPDGKTGTIGISTYAAKALGDVVFVELPTLELEVSAGDSIGAVESVKSASDIMTPVSGTVIEANGVLEAKPGTINQGPEGEGWIAKISISDAEEMEGLMDAEGYRKFTEE